MCSATRWWVHAIHACRTRTQLLCVLYKRKTREHLAARKHTVVFVFMSNQFWLPWFCCPWAMTQDIKPPLPNLRFWWYLWSGDGWNWAAKSQHDYSQTCIEPSAEISVFGHASINPHVYNACTILHEKYM